MRKNCKNKFWRFTQSAAVLFLCMGLASPVNAALAAESAQSAQSLQEAERELQGALENQKAAQEKYNQGSMGFVEWMMAKDGLTQLQKKDLEQAKTILSEACEENFSRWYGGKDTGLPENRKDKVTCLWDDNDAASLKNTKASFPILKNINKIRQEDQNYVGAMRRNPGETNFYVMAIAQTGADRGAGLTRHSRLQISCENLAFGYKNPEDGWNREVTAFNQLKESLGMSVLSKESDVKAITDLADAQKKTVTHYTNLFWSADQVMGIGVTDYGSYGTTSCYNATAKSNYENKYAIYTIQQFEKLFMEYYATVDPDVMQARVDAAQQKLNDQKAQQCTGHDFVMQQASPGAGKTTKTCTKCGYTQEAALPTAITKVTWWKNDSAASEPANYQIGDEIKLEVAGEVPADSADNQAYVIEVSNPSVAAVSDSENGSYAGILTITGSGSTTVTVYAKYDPSVKQEYTLSVNSKGNNAQAETKIGTVFSAGSLQYKVTGSSEVTVTGLSQKKPKTVNIPDTVARGKTKFKVTAIAAKAFSYTDVARVTIGANVKTIGSAAFKGCKKLSAADIRSKKLVTVGKDAFKGIYAAAKIKVPSAKYAAYQKLLQNKGQGKKVKIVR